MIKRIKRAFLSLGFVFATEFNNPRLASKILTTLTQDEFAPVNAQERKQWESWHEAERSFVKPAWIGKPRLPLAMIMRQNLNKEVKRRLEQKA